MQSIPKVRQCVDNMENPVMKENDVLAFITKYFSTEFEVPVEKIVPEASLFQDLGLDSIDALDMVGMLESELNIQVDESEIRSIRTVDDVVKYVMKKTESAQ